MSAIIKILPQPLADKIAAGEVVQRPASAVKELIENSIDAQAKSITIIVKDGGKSLIHIIDDGAGMTPEDASLAFARHSTSKISTYEDLENIRTLGFRGEALASIAAISRVEMKTRQRSSPVATSVRIEGGITLEISEDAAPVGTSIIAKNLFYNTPARRNFLKSNATEYKHIVDVVQRVALSHPECSINLTSDDETIFQLRSTTLNERVSDLFGDTVAGSLLFFQEETELAHLQGFLGKPNFARKGRAEQYLFLNGRYVVNRTINHAVFQAYEHLLEKGTFPLFILFLTIDPRKVDVNVHPSKMEVKFDDESAIYRFILTAVRKALSAHDLIPTMGMRDQQSENSFRLQQRTGSSDHRVTNWQELLRPPDEAHRQSGFKLVNDHTALSSIEAGSSEPPTFSEPNLNPAQSPEPQSLTSGVALWQLHNKYIIVPIDGGLMIVDQHAAHERILYERAVVRFQGGDSHSQQLLFPHTLQMSASDASLVLELLPLLERLGFSAKLFGKTTVIVDGVPTDIRPGEEATILQRIIDLYKENDSEIKVEPRERLAKSFSCRAAVKSGDSLKPAEMSSLLDQLFATKIPYVCPHGRPSIIKLSLSELDKRFGRTPISR